jgi:glycosyltransferase involved in cell wall biosynthesis
MAAVSQTGSHAASPRPTAASVERTLHHRLSAVGRVLLRQVAAAPSGAGTDPDSGELLYRLVDALQPDPPPDQMWLLCAGVLGAYPTADDVLSGTRKLRLASSADAMLWLLDRALERDSAAAGVSELRIVSNRVVVDVDYSARHDLHTGIQQVVRNTLPRWQEKHPILPVAWTTRFDGWRGLSASERPRLALDGDPEDEAAGQPEPVLIVPWRTVSVLLETPPLEACERLACLARYSGNALVAVGYDCVPVVSADLVPAADTVRFTHYLTTIKHARRVAGISTSAANEFAGFASGLGAQGISGPTVLACPLASEGLPGHTSGGASGTCRPTGGIKVLCVGSLEPRKNHLGVLYAAERLWREGLHFELVLVAGSGWGHEVPDRIAELRDAGRSVTVRRAVDGVDLADAYRQARFSVSASFHEGYGLPIAESLAVGTPVIATSYGSAREVAAGGGALFVDPRDDEALVDAMRDLLTDEVLVERLRAEARQRPIRTWERYAAELWEALVAPELEGIRGDQEGCE